MTKKPSFGPNFSQFWPKFGPPNFFVGFTSTRCYALLQGDCYHWMQFQGKLMNQTWENGKDLVLGLIFAPLAQLSPPPKKKKIIDFTSTRY